MGIGQILSDTFGVVKARFGPLLALWAIYFAISMAMGVALVIGIGTAGVAGLATLSEGNELAAGAGMIVVAVLFYLGYLLVAMAQYASMIAMASPIRQPTVSEALGAGWRAAPALLLLMLVMAIGYIVLTVPVAIFVSAFPTEGNAVSALLLLLLVPVLVWLGCRLAPLLAVVAVDGVRNPFAAIARAWRLTRGHALTILFASLVFMVVLVLACGAALLPSLGLLGTLADPAALAEAESSVGQAVGGFMLFGLGMLVASVLFIVCYSAFQAVIHGTLANAAGEGTAQAFA